ncbi:hypothetical protein [Rhodospirillum rubrum]|nr:hypothetical protein [Rhodospirillum rubrum]AEO47540.1 hypothetical protein F11_05350 [Rhodospirillum rubrum F11]QXG81501.1 hypothetical protein KUL73_05410 [Rhodospirillum rubrum]
MTPSADAPRSERTEEGADGKADRFRLLDALFVEAELLAHGKDGRPLTPQERLRLSAITEEIDGLLNRIEGRCERPAADLASPDLWGADVPPPASPLACATPPTSRPCSGAMDENDIETALRSVAVLVPASRSCREADRAAGLIRRPPAPPLALDVENALDTIAAYLDDGRSFDPLRASLLAQFQPRPLPPTEARLIGALSARMEQILDSCTDAVLSPEAERDLDDLLAEADRILGRLDSPARPGASCREAAAWRKLVDGLGRQVTTLFHDPSPLHAR